MTIDELKTSLSSITDDNKADVIDKISTDYASQLEKDKIIEDKDKEILDLKSKVSDLADTNMRLVDKIKYVDDVAQEQKENREDNPDVTIDDIDLSYSE